MKRIYNWICESRPLLYQVTVNLIRTPCMKFNLGEGKRLLPAWTAEGRKRIFVLATLTGEARASCVCFGASRVRWQWKGWLVVGGWKYLISFSSFFFFSCCGPSGAAIWEKFSRTSEGANVGRRFIFRSWMFFSRFSSNPTPSHPIDCDDGTKVLQHSRSWRSCWRWLRIILYSSPFVGSLAKMCAVLLGVSCASTSDTPEPAPVPLCSIHFVILRRYKFNSYRRSNRLESSLICFPPCISWLLLLFLDFFSFFANFTKHDGLIAILYAFI